MELQRIIAPDVRQATAEVARRYGPNALIVSSRMLIHGRTEIIVAIETGQPANESKSLSNPRDSAEGEGTFDRILREALTTEPSMSAQSRPVALPSQGPLGTETGLQDESTARAPFAPGRSSPLPHRDQEGEAIVRLIRSELAELRAELSAMRHGRHNHPANVVSKQFARGRLAAGGLASGPLDSLLAKVGESVDLPVLTDAMRALLESRQHTPWAGRVHMLQGESSSDCTEVMLALAHAQESARGPGSACVISLASQDEEHWSRLQHACLSRAIGVLRLKDIKDLRSLVDHLASTSTACFVTAPRGITEAALHQLEAQCRKIKRHLILAPGQNRTEATEPPLAEMSWDSIVFHRLERPGALLPLISLALAENLAVSATTDIAEGTIEIDGDLARLAARALAPIGLQFANSLGAPPARITTFTEASLASTVADAMLP